MIKALVVAVRKSEVLIREVKLKTGFQQRDRQVGGMEEAKLKVRRKGERHIQLTVLTKPSSEEESPTATHTERTKDSAEQMEKGRKAYIHPDVQFDHNADEAIEERSEFTPNMCNVIQMKCYSWLQTKQTYTVYRRKIS